MDKPNPESIQAHLRESLNEDAVREDVTTRALSHPDQIVESELLAREAGVLCGRPIVNATFDLLANMNSFPSEIPEVDWSRVDGDGFEESSRLATVSGPASIILAGERVALNYLQQLSGVATRTSTLVTIADPYDVDVYDTRKTVPHYRAFQKYAVRCGGGQNHRMDLSEALMVKDNHKALAGDLDGYLDGLSTHRPVIVEIHHPAEVDVVRNRLSNPENDVDITVLMLDNFKPDAIRDIMTRVPESVDVEVSGGIRKENLKAYCQAGPDRVSVGALTHSFDSLDLSLKFTSFPSS